MFLFGCSRQRFLEPAITLYRSHQRSIFSSFQCDPWLLEKMKNNSNLCHQYLSSSKFLVIHDRKYLVKPLNKTRAQVSFKCFSDLKKESIIHSVLLQASGNTAIFGVSIKNVEEVMEKDEFLIEPRPALFSLCQDELNISTMSLNLLQWQADNKYCSKCCSKLKYHASGRSCKCINCCLTYFPRYNPVVIMLVICGNYCLLGHNKNFPSNMFSALAGFIDVGETIEDAVVREVYEEVGIVIDPLHVKYIKSDFWGGFRRNYSPELMLGCVAYVENIKDPMCSDEISDARWFHKKDIKCALMNAQSVQKDHSLHSLQDGSYLQVPPPFATAHHLMSSWCSNSLNV